MLAGREPGPARPTRCTRSSPATTGSSRTNAVNALHVTVNKTINDRVIPEFFAPKDIGAAVDNDPAVPGFMGLSITGGFSIGQGGNNPGYFNSLAYQIADDFDWIKGRHQISVRRQLHPLEDRDGEQPADQRRVHVQRLEHRPRHGRLHDSAR